MMITSTFGSTSNSKSASETSLTAAALATATSRISNWTDGHRRFAFSTTSFPASLFRPQIRPTLFGRNGSGSFRDSSNKPSRASLFFNASSRASNSPSPTLRSSFTWNASEPFLLHHCGLDRITMRAFCSSGATESKTFLKHLIEMLISALVSRNRIKIVGEPGRTFISDNSPSIQSSGRSSIICPIRSVT
ncbi:unannotated protein [freshwater metagenome]|uniref:Unannotated protein n=1 Tax=freshwater metagenome TaxID=449393 RepID=A0A6J6MSV0_9ZZZZ